jgi:prephenate dehydrogenase
MTQVGIVGLGLIGGSLAKAYKRVDGIRVLEYDRYKSTMDFASLAQGRTRAERRTTAARVIR